MRKFVKAVLHYLPFKKQLFGFLKWFYVPGEKIYRHLYFKGVFKVKVSENISFLIRHYGYELENEIFWEGLTSQWEKRSITTWMQLSEKAKVILDIGSNTGVFSLVTKSLNPCAKVFAFEPVERVFQKLCANVSLNNYDIVCYHKAVSNYIGDASFYDTDSEHIYTVVINKDLSHDKNYHEVKVPVTTIDEVIREQQPERIDLVKIDVERHEPEVLEGFSMIWKFKPTILIEILDDETGGKVESVLDKYGCSYLYFDIDEEKGFKKMEHIKQSSGFNYLLCTENTAKQLGLL
jgi:FkbM family methyltransferase